MQLVTFYDGVKTIDISLAKDAGYAFPLPFMPVVVDMLTLTTPVGETRMAIKNTRLELEHLALSVADGEANLYYHGYELLTASTGAFEVERFELGEGVHSEHILSPKNARPEDIKTWANMRGPFFDPSPLVPNDQIPSSATWDQAVTNASDALRAAATAQATADGKVTTFYQDTPPTAEGLGDLWVDTGNGNILMRWDGEHWVKVQDEKIQEAVQAARDAQATADGKIVTWYRETDPQDDPDITLSVGDLWVDTSDDNHLWRWSGTEWQDLRDTSPIPDERIPSSSKWDNKNRTYYQATAPEGVHTIGDIWFDTSDHHKRHWWDGDAWQEADQESMYIEGAYGDIEMDKTGMRFIRDPRGNAETVMHFDMGTGSAYFKGDITGASGTFSGPVKSIDAEGNYSLLDEARLRFYRRIGNEDILSYYVAQIATGQAADGQVVDLAALGYRFFERPKIVLQPKLNRVFVANTTSQDVWMDWDVLDETFDPATGAATFRVRARTIIKGGTVFGSFTPNKLQVVGTSTATTTGPGTTYLRFKISGYSYDANIFRNATLEFWIQYRKRGTTNWMRLDTQIITAWGHAELPPTNFSYNVPDAGSSGYDVRVLLAYLSNVGENPRTTPHLTIHEFEYRSGDTILSDPANPEIVSWIAIDGG